MYRKSRNPGIYLSVTVTLSQCVCVCVCLCEQNSRQCQTHVLLAIRVTVQAHTPQPASITHTHAHTHTHTHTYCVNYQLTVIYTRFVQQWMSMGRSRRPGSHVIMLLAGSCHHAASRITGPGAVLLCVGVCMCVREGCVRVCVSLLLCPPPPPGLMATGS